MCGSIIAPYRAKNRRPNRLFVNNNSRCGDGGPPKFIYLRLKDAMIYELRQVQFTIRYNTKILLINTIEVSPKGKEKGKVMMIKE